MGQFQDIHKYLAVVVVLILCHEIVITQGRQIKAVNQNEDTRNNNGAVLPAADKAGDVFGDSNGDQVNAHRPTTPGNSPGVGHKRSTQDNKDANTKLHVLPLLQNPPNAEYSFTQESKTDLRPTNQNFNLGIEHAPLPEIKP